MRSVLGRTRLPLVVSLFLAALLGAPAAGGPIRDPLPIPVTAAVAVAAAPAPAPAIVADTVETEPPAAAVAPVQPALPAAPLLSDQVSSTATAPRGPPRTA
jgi:hypothetical protein